MGGDTNLNVEPLFVSYDADGISDDLHLDVRSLLVDAGDPATSLDADGSLPDIGIYGGENGSKWDLDLDGYYDYFWPGTFPHQPYGVDRSSYDCDDNDSDIIACP